MLLSPDTPCVDSVHPSPNHGARRAEPDSIILHYTGMADADAALSWLCNPRSEVSCHYFVFEDGRIAQLVPESRRAWHAGRSCWHGERDMNSRSIGIEIAHPGHNLAAPEGAPPGPFPPPGPAFPEAQVAAVIRLVAEVKARRHIPDARILAHSDIAPGRKIDPGERFPWARLAGAGLGQWPRPLPAVPPQDVPACQPDDAGPPVAAMQMRLARFGYDIALSGVYDRQTCDVIAAFQRHWRQARVDGLADAGTMAVLEALLAG